MTIEGNLQVLLWLERSLQGAVRHQMNGKRLHRESGFYPKVSGVAVDTGQITKMFAL